MTLLEVGRIHGAHGIRGEVTVSLVTDRSERVEPDAVLSTEHGPLKVISSRPHKGKWIVAFDGITTRTEAEAMQGTVLRAEAIEDSSDALWVHELVGAEVFCTAGIRRGEVVAVEANPASDLLVLDDGHLVPVRFVATAERGRLVVDAPAGLFD